MEENGRRRTSYLGAGVDVSVRVGVRTPMVYPALTLPTAPGTLYDAGPRTTVHAWCITDNENITTMIGRMVAFAAPSLFSSKHVVLQLRETSHNRWSKRSGSENKIRNGTVPGPSLFCANGSLKSVLAPIVYADDDRRRESTTLKQNHFVAL